MKTTFLFLLISLSSQTLIAQCWQSVVSTYNHSIALKYDGTIWGWGSNDFGEQGDGTDVNYNDAPVQIGTDSDWKFVTVGASFCFAIKTNGTLWAWGLNDYGQLGDGTTVNRLSPVQIGTDTDWKLLSAGFGNVKAIKNNGTLWSWGWDMNGAQGNGSPEDDVHVPTQTGTDSDWAAISVGNDCSLALKTNGTLWSCGYNDIGQLGIGTINTPNTDVYVQVGSASDWKHIAMSINAYLSTSCLATKTNGTLWTWGREILGAESEYAASPQQIGTETNWNEVGLGNSFSCMATKTDNSLWAWGANDYGTVGDGTTTNRYEPVLIDDTHSWNLSRSGALYCTAISDGSIYSWGANWYGQLGLGTNTSQFETPQQVGTSCGLGIEETELSFEIYPNPVAEELHIRISEPLVINRIVVTTISGQQALIKEGASDFINVKDLTSGSYVVEVFSGNRSFRELFVKE